MGAAPYGEIYGMIADTLKAGAAFAWLGAMNGTLRFMERVLWPRRRPREVRTVCIHRVGSIGDIVCAIPAIKAIRANYPRAHITLLTSSSGNMPGARNILAQAKWLDEIWVYGQDEIIRDPWRFFMAVRARSFDVWVNLPQRLANIRREMRNMLFARLAGSRWACGFRVSITDIFRKAQARTRLFPPEHDRLLDILRDAELLVERPEMDLPVTQGDRVLMARRLADLGVGTAPLLGMAPGGKQPACVWPLERFIEVGRRWIEGGGKVLVIGGPSERYLGESIRVKLGAAVMNICGETSVLQTAEALRHCDILLTNDSGPMHLAGAVGTPCVVPMTAHNFKWEWRPWGNCHHIIRKDEPCSPCHLVECDRNNVCLATISIDEVWEKANPFIKCSAEFVASR